MSILSGFSTPHAGQRRILTHPHEFFGRVYGMITGLPFLFVSQNGPSGLFMPNGEIVASLGVGERGVMVVSVGF